jgi:hypothetical protein
MITLLSAILLLHQATPQAARDTVPAKDTAAIREAKRDSSRHLEALRDSARTARWRAKRDVVITPEMLATAYKDPAARTLIARARRARVEQDSSLRYYDAIARERFSGSMSLSAAGSQKLVLRSETASRVRWQLGRGAIVDVLGARTAFPMFFQDARVLSDFLEMDPIPYFPGREELPSLEGTRLASTTEEGLFMHPLDRGAEAFYTYRAGDSVVFHLPDGSSIHIRAVAVQARKPAPDLIVGSLWFDEASGHLVRGVFRPAAPLNIKKLAEEDDSTAFQDVPLFVRPMIFPMEMTVEAFTVEYGLHEQHWWLPRVETLSGRFRIGFMHGSGSMEQSFSYSSVNGRDTIPRLFASADDSLRHVPGDSIHEWVRDSTRAARKAHRDSVRAAEQDSGTTVTMSDGRRRRRSGSGEDDDLEHFHCSGTDTTISRSMRYGGTLPVRVVVPCDTLALLHSPELPPSIYDNGEQLFDLKERDALVSELTMGLQPGWDPQPYTWHYGIENSLIRYNRVDALDAGVQVARDFGSGYSGDLTARISSGGPKFYGEAHFRRGDGVRSYDIGLYSRLASANDWGDPLTFRASLNGFILGQDLGFYYNAWGAELRSARYNENGLTWRLFAEQQSNAAVTTQTSIPNWINGHEFSYNVQTPMTNAFGASVRYRDEVGLDPHGWRASYDARGEGAAGTFEYGRVAFDGTVSHGLGRHLDWQLGAGAGTSLGDLPPQRNWFLGGAWTIRGQQPGTASGNAYWLGHAELGSSFVAVRPTLFFDIGWAGDRNDWKHIGMPVSGAGVGLSFLDGIFRLDIAHAVQPTGGWILDFSTSARF